MSDQSPRRRATGATLLRFLGSMNLAITLLVALSIAAVIGTVLQQNQAYTDYIIKFGPFWFEVFKALDLYDVYGATWFLALLGFLLASTAVCVYRNTPAVVRDMRQFRLGVQEKSLRGFRHQAEWRSERPAAESAATVVQALRAAGYRVRAQARDGRTTVAAMKGSVGRLGYVLSHVAIVVICIGGLIDGNLELKVAEMTGEVRPETRDIAASEVPPQSTLGQDNDAFRASVTIPEGQRARVAFMRLGEGYLVQQLPFAIEVKDFRIEHYATGQPKSFESDLVIHDSARDEPLARTIAVNHPLVYNGYSIYQASFADGGSRLRLLLHSFARPQSDPVALDGVIGESLDLQTPGGRRTLEFIDFKPFNIFPVEEGDPDADGKKQRNFGPSVVFKVRRPNGEALEYNNYMLPLRMNGRRYLLTGVRNSTAESYRYMHIPVDGDGGPGRFWRFLALARDEARVRAAAVAQTGAMAGGDERQASALSDGVVRLVGQFAREGIEPVVAAAEQQADEASREQAMQTFTRVLQSVLGALYIDLLREEGIDVAAGLSDADAAWFDDALGAMSLLGPYGSAFYLQLTDFTQVQAAGLEITKSPGKDIVYLGCVLLIAGVFFMFYVHHRRLWVLVDSDGGSRLLLAGTGHRERADFDHEFERLHHALAGATGGHVTSD